MIKEVLKENLTLNQTIYTENNPIEDALALLISAGVGGLFGLMLLALVAGEYLRRFVVSFTAPTDY